MDRKDQYSRLELLIYAGSWLLIFIIPFAVEMYDVLSGRVNSFHLDHVMKVVGILFPIFLLFLLNNFVLLPRLFFKQRKAWYFLVLLVCFVILWYIQTPPEPPHRPPHMGRGPEPVFGMFHITNLIVEMCVILANFAIKVYVNSLRKDTLMLNIQNEKMQSELESLKYQISPHFLMNTLNNIQSLIESDPSRACHTIQELSRMMRYLLYENTASTVALQKEVDFMVNFINLMKIRYPDMVRVSTNFPVDCGDVTVPPLLFISFLENAFKYGVSYMDESFVTVSLSIEGDRLLFQCANSISRRSRSHSSTDRSGIGIENVRRRLKLIYGESSSMTIDDNGKIYVVEIVLPVTIRKEDSHD